MEAGTCLLYIHICVRKIHAYYECYLIILFISDNMNFFLYFIFRWIRMENSVPLQNRQPQSILKVSSSAEELNGVQIEDNRRLNSIKMSLCGDEVSPEKKNLIKLIIDFVLLVACKYFYFKKNFIWPSKLQRYARDNFTAKIFEWCDLTPISMWWQFQVYVACKITKIQFNCICWSWNPIYWWWSTSLHST